MFDSCETTRSHHDQIGANVFGHFDDGLRRKFRRHRRLDRYTLGLDLLLSLPELVHDRLSYIVVVARRSCDAVRRDATRVELVTMWEPDLRAERFRNVEAIWCTPGHAVDRAAAGGRSLRICTRYDSQEYLPPRPRYSGSPSARAFTKSSSRASCSSSAAEQAAMDFAAS